MPPAYTRCPKCAHKPLPADQALPAACPGCGVILAKLGTAARHLNRRPIDTEAPGEPGWSALQFWSRVAMLAGLALWSWGLIAMDYRTGEMGASFIHRPLLVFHEAGHVIFMPLGHWLMVLGGTLGQLLMPLILAGALLFKNRDPFGAAVGLWFFGVSLLDVAPYVYDALHPQLMLLSGTTGEAGGHDWIYLLTRLGWLDKSPLLGGLTHELGALVVLLALGWAAWLLRQQHSRVAVKVHEKDQ